MNGSSNAAFEKFFWPWISVLFEEDALLLVGENPELFLSDASTSLFSRFRYISGQAIIKLLILPTPRV